jgi:hypothetical protein
LNDLCSKSSSVSSAVYSPAPEGYLSPEKAETTYKLMQPMEE